MLIDFRRKEVIIPIGCDCHPSHLLETLNLRKISLPFDWLDTQPLKGLTYVQENIRTRFRYFQEHLKVNDDDKAYSESYNYSVFFHHSDIVHNKRTYNKFIRRSKRFMKLVQKRRCTYLYAIGSLALNSPESVQVFHDSIIKFKEVLKRGDRLLIYIRYDDSLEENASYCKILDEQLAGEDKVRLAHYNRHFKEFGLWGDSSKYPFLLDAFGVDTNNIEPFLIQSTANRLKLSLYGLWTNLKQVRQAV
jgi:hypothetical protein